MKNALEATLALAALLLPASLSAADPVSVPDAREIDLSIYEPGIALVHDRRRVGLPAGRSRLGWDGVADRLELDSVRLSGGALELRRWRRLDRPLDLPALLAAHVGRQVALRDVGAYDSGTLVSAEPTLVATGDGVIAVRADQLVFPQGVPGELGRGPALELAVEAGGVERNRAVTLSYLAHGLDWTLDYVGRVSADGERLDLVARASIRNDAGMPLRNARVELIAGAPRLPATDNGPGRVRTLESASTSRGAGADAGPEAAGEYYRLALPQPVTLAAGEEAHWTVFRREAVALDRTHVLRAGVPVRPLAGDAEGWQRVPLETALRWTVQGGPQPGGAIRFYQARPGDGVERLLGGARPGDRAEGEAVEVYVGEPFDLVAERRQTAYERAADGDSETSTREIRVRNARDRPASVRIEETVHGAWEMLASNAEWERPSSNLAVWRVEVPAGEVRLIRYRVRVQR